MNFVFILMESTMSQSTPQVEKAIVQRKNKKPKWVEALLRRTFFDSCSVHPARRNEKNRYCITCSLSACQYCMSSGNHRHHKIVKIYRHVYRDVVSLGAMETYLDCSQIQPYKCNKRLVISLYPLPHCGPLSNNGVCDICKRRLAEPELYNYCSLSCKVAAFGSKLDESVPPFLSQQIPISIKRMEESKPEKPKHRRKGKPTRAPFF